MKRQLVAVGVVLFVALGCTAEELNRADPAVPQSPCNANNSYWCGPKLRVCCYTALPYCAVDDDGAYCLTGDGDPSDPTTWAKRRHRGKPIPESR